MDEDRVMVSCFVSPCEYIRPAPTAQSFLTELAEFACGIRFYEIIR
jgi:hypothetical protein